jgi:hypothetical protein
MQKKDFLYVNTFSDAGKKDKGILKFFEFKKRLSLKGLEGLKAYSFPLKIT